MLMYDDGLSKQCTSCGSTNIHLEEEVTAEVINSRKYRCLDCGYVFASQCRVR